MESNGNDNIPPTSMCKNGCGFYGSSQFENMCSKCYKDSVKRKNASPVSGRLSPMATTIVETTADKVDSMTVSLAQANLGLRQLPSPPKKIKGLTNAERCKKYREDIQNDAERHAAKRLADMERCKKNYYRPRTEEELQMRREKERLRKQAYRNRQKATRAAEHHLSLTPSQPKTRKAVENQREKWRSDQQQARAKWTAQKWRRHREKCSRYYHGKKAEKDEPISSSGELETASPTVTVAASSSQDKLAQVVAEDGAVGGVDVDDASSDGSGDRDKKPKKNRCHTCRKKVGLTGFQCRCGGLYCGIHRYSDKHQCSFDYKEHGMEQIRKNNPIIVGSKVQKI